MAGSRLRRSLASVARGTSRALLLLVLGLAALLPAGRGQTAEPEPLDEEFLEYLAKLEGKEDNWTLFASAREPREKRTRTEKPDTKVKQ